MTELADTILFSIIALYFLPTLIAVFNRKHSGRVVLLNLLLGWTYIGWVIALIWACISDKSADLN